MMSIKKTKKSTVGYTGNVTVKVLHGNKVVKTYKKHNTGTYRLFEYIARCLGNTYDEMYAPRFIRAFYIDDIENIPDSELHTYLSENVISGAIAYSRIEVKSDEAEQTATVTFSFLVPNSLIYDNQLYINALAMYSLTTYDDASIEDPMAYVKLDNKIEVTEGSNILIEWGLTITNAQTEE